ncbi:hypothetical protein MMC10_005903 [Thelotrema lepadinum]|nr:hypothetical protein [Thelotrema lepadinum]
MPICIFACLLLCLCARTLGTGNVQVVINTNVDSQSTTTFPRALGESRYSTRFPDVEWDDSAWTLTTTTVRPADFRSAAFTANGYIGLSMASVGPFVQTFPESGGWPVFDQRRTFGTVGGFFDRQPTTNGTNFLWLQQYGWDSVISGIPSWSPLILELESGEFLNANTSTSELSNIKLTQDFRKGLAKWQYTWTPSKSDGLSMDIIYTAFADKLYIKRAYVQLQVQPSKDVNVTVANVLDGFTALRTNPIATGSDGDLIYSAVSPYGVDEVTAWVYAGMKAPEGMNFSSLITVKERPYMSDSASSIAQSAVLSLQAGNATTITKYVGVASTDAFQDPKTEAKNAATQATKDGYTKSLQAHIYEWEQVLPKDSVSDFSDPSTGSLPAIPSLIEKSIVEVVSVFGLLMNTVSENALAIVNNASVNVNGISVCGLTTDCYGGQKFWDENTWMQPLLTASFPSAAKQITNSRVQQYAQAKKNIQTAYQSSQNQTKFSENSAIYPWTSGRDANCTATGPCFDYEYHLNGDIALSFVTLWASSGDTEYFKNNLYDPLQSIATTFSDLLQKNGLFYELKNSTDPDEYANHVDDAGFTMPLAAYSMNSANWFREAFGQSRNTQWDKKMSNLLIPTVGDISLEYEGMNGTIEVKQADVVLKIYPLGVQENYTQSDQQADLDYYAGRQSTNGPGMTYAIFSIDASEISPSGCSAYTYDLGSWSAYLREPWFSFSEQLVDDPTLNGGTNPAFPFLTGHGGFLQVDLYGYLGLRYSTGYTLRVNPTLPPQIPHLAYPTFYHHGWPIKAVASATTTTLTRLPYPLPSANTTFAKAPIPVIVGKTSAGSRWYSYSLKPNGTIHIVNRQFQNNKTVPGNILQCLPDITSNVAFSPGQFPLAAIDGAISTAWEATNASIPSSITVDTSTVPFQVLTSLSFDWGNTPPVNATVILHNQSCPDTAPGRALIQMNNIAISDPFDLESANEVKPYKGNTTTVDLTELEYGTELWSGNWATLFVYGNANDSSITATAATVAEWAIVGSF